jgi:hypothetical protein
MTHPVHSDLIAWQRRIKQRLVRNRTLCPQTPCGLHVSKADMQRAAFRCVCGGCVEIDQSLETIHQLPEGR